jgi:hypothetical protein
VSDDKPASGFVPLKSVARRGTASSGSGSPGEPDPAAALAEIRQIYFKTSRRTIEHDFAHAIELLKALPDEATRQKAHVYMEGLSEMRKEWEKGSKVKGQKSKVKP